MAFSRMATCSQAASSAPYWTSLHKFQYTIREYTLRSTYTQTFDFDFAAATRVMAVKVDLRAEYETLKATERFFHVDFGKH